MNRRFVAGLVLVTAGILMAPAAGTASAEVCAWGEVKSDCAAGITSSTTPTSVNGEADSGSSSVSLGEAEGLIQTLVATITGG